MFSKICSAISRLLVVGVLLSSVALAQDQAWVTAKKHDCALGCSPAFDTLLPPMLFMSTDLSPIKVGRDDSQLVQNYVSTYPYATLVVPQGTKQGAIKGSCGQIWDVDFALRGDLQPGTAISSYLKPTWSSEANDNEKLLWILRVYQDAEGSYLKLEFVKEGIVLGTNAGGPVPVGFVWRNLQQLPTMYFTLSKAEFMSYGGFALQFVIRDKPVNAGAVFLDITTVYM